MEASIWQLIMDASPVVKIVMLILVLMSMACWYIIGVKFRQLSRADNQSDRFLQLFWGQGQRGFWDVSRLEGIYAQLAPFAGSPLAKVFHAGYVELARITGSTAPQPASDYPQAQPQTGGGLENVERALKRSSTGELTKIEGKLPFLATTGSTAPFIGLFGTVWGIMNSFLAIRAQGNASLDVVGGDIAEALIATALGLAAAIPAVMAYNYYLRRVRILEGEIESFTNDFLNIVRRHFLTA